jgi:hypothetical protein
MSARSSRRISGWAARGLGKQIGEMLESMHHRARA